MEIQQTEHPLDLVLGDDVLLRRPRMGVDRVEARADIMHRCSRAVLRAWAGAACPNACASAH